MSGFFRALSTIKNIKFACFPYIGADGYFEFDECDVLVTHMPPSNTKTSTDKNGNDWGDMDLYHAIKNKIIKPKIILCGHMHHPTKTLDKLNAVTIYNTGVDTKSKIPKHHIVEI